MADGFSEISDLRGVGEGGLIQRPKKTKYNDRFDMLSVAVQCEAVHLSNKYLHISRSKHKLNNLMHSGRLVALTMLECRGGQAK